MKRIIGLFATASIVTALSVGPALSSGDHEHEHGSMKSEPTAQAEETRTVKGEIVDLACYLGHGAKGPQHQQCALTCLKGGQPMGLLTADGTVYLLMASHEDGKPYDQAKEWAALQVEVSGPYVEKAGIKALTVGAAKKM